MAGERATTIILIVLLLGIVPIVQVIVLVPTQVPWSGVTVEEVNETGSV